MKNSKVKAIRWFLKTIGSQDNKALYKTIKKELSGKKISMQDFEDILGKLEEKDKRFKKKFLKGSSE